MLYKLLLLILIVLIGVSLWLTPKIIKAENVDIPCVQLVGPFYYCGNGDVMQQFLDRIKSNPNFQF